MHSLATPAFAPDAGRAGSIPESVCPRGAAAGRYALAIMAKAPREGAVKTRLVPPLLAAEAAALSRCFIADMAENIAGVGSADRVRGWVAYTPVGQEAAFDGLLPGGFGLVPQRGDGFGERLLHAMEDLLATGHGGAFLINSDSPDLPQALLAQAVAALERPGDRVVLGPATDGGYYLIGLKRLHREMFARIDWSTERVLAQSLERAAEIGLPVELLPPWYDVDDEAALRHLLRVFADGVRGGAGEPALQPYPAPRTRRLLAELMRTGAGMRLGLEAVAGS